MQILSMIDSESTYSPLADENLLFVILDNLSHSKWVCSPEGKSAVVGLLHKTSLLNKQFNEISGRFINEILGDEFIEGVLSAVLLLSDFLMDNSEIHCVSKSLMNLCSVFCVKCAEKCAVNRPHSQIIKYRGMLTKMITVSEKNKIRMLPTLIAIMLIIDNTPNWSIRNDRYYPSGSMNYSLMRWGFTTLNYHLN